MYDWLELKAFIKSEILVVYIVKVIDLPRKSDFDYSISKSCIEDRMGLRYLMVDVDFVAA